MTHLFYLVMIVAAAVVVGQAITGEIWICGLPPWKQVSRDSDPGSFWLEIAFQSLVVLSAVTVKIYPQLFGSK